MLYRNFIIHYAHTDRARHETHDRYSIYTTHTQLVAALRAIFANPEEYRLITVKANH